ncbi:hypothetical protein H311_00448 [Anncaliia algerae PRA109]|nr:hypothetical protein H311_00448 [Anncaliia algerae PRA109]
MYKRMNIYSCKYDFIVEVKKTCLCKSKYNRMTNISYKINYLWNTIKSKQVIIKKLIKAMEKFYCKAMDQVRVGIKAYSYYLCTSQKLHSIMFEFCKLLICICNYINYDEYTFTKKL